MSSLISKKLKEIRKVMNISQKELAEGICTQAVISNIEKNAVIPSSVTLYKIAKKLGVDINFFLNEDFEESSTNDFKEIKKIIRSLVKKNEYKSVYYIVQNELNNIDNKTFGEKQFLLWHKGICEYYVNKNIFEAINILTSIINLNEKITTPQELSVLNSLAVVYFEEKDYKKSFEIFEKCFESLANVNNLELQIELRILYGYARVLANLNKVEDSTFILNLVIEKCLEGETIYLLGETYFQIGRNFLLINENDNAINYLNKSKTLFDIQNNASYLNIIEKTLALTIRNMSNAVQNN